MTSIKKQNDQRYLSVVRIYYEQIKKKQEDEELEKNKATVIQAKFRMHKLLITFKSIRSATIAIQKHMRKFLASKLFRKLLSKKHQEYNVQNIDDYIQQLKYYGGLAMVIQRYYKGYIKRKFKHDFYARQKYLTFLKRKNSNFKKEMEQVAVNEKFEENMIKEKCAKEELTILASNLHHLVSTNCQPGIYKAPYAKQQPKVFDIDLEVHLKTAYRMKSKKKKSNDGFRVRSTSYYK